MVLALEHMAQVSVTTLAQDFSPDTVGIRELLYSSFNFLIESGPTATGIKLTGGLVEWSVASPAEISPRFTKFVVLT
tara:strand:+ start:575 stop:805 length:231 start_codon:yes stop_codon:yes gene_type:complete